MKHALVIGGSGMLTGTTVWLAEQGYLVTVVGRNVPKLERVADRHDGIFPVSADYNDIDSFISALETAICERGEFSLVVAWIHNDKEKIINRLHSELFSNGQNSWDLYHVLGSASNLEEILKQLKMPHNCNYHQVQLGFILEGDSSRWLTHEEISNGVNYCIRTGQKKHLVGTLTPWYRRP